MKIQISHEVKIIRDDILALKLKMTNEIKNHTKENSCVLNSSEVRSTQINNNKNRIMVKSINHQHAGDTMNLVKNNIDITELGINVNKILNTLNGNIIIDVEKEEDRLRISKVIHDKFRNSLKVTNINKKIPRIKIIGLEKRLISMDESAFIDAIINQNSISALEEKHHIKIVKRYMKTQNKGSAIVELSPLIHGSILKSNKLKIGWDSYYVYNHLNILQFYQCWGFNHVAKNCKKNIACRNCAEQRNVKDCKNEMKKCINCIRFTNKLNSTDLKIDHEATDKQCGC